MANVEDERPDFDELEGLPEDPFAAAPVAQPDLVEESEAPAEPEEKAPEEKPKGKRKWRRKRKDKDVEQVGREDQDQGEEADEDQSARGRALAVLAQADPYTVMLAVALLAALIAIFCLWMELRRYDFDIKASGVQLPAATVLLAQAVPPTVS